MNSKINPSSANPLKGKDTASIIYHYTTIDTLLGIVRKDNIVMWATHYQYLNDSSEIKTGIEILKKIESLEVHEEIFENLFIISFSLTADNLPMWTSYSNQYSGCVLGFKNNKEIVEFQCSYDSDESEKVKVIGQYIKCSYDPDELKEILADNKEAAFEGRESLSAEDSNIIELETLLEKSTPMTIRAKNSAFGFEDEIRLFSILEHDKTDIIKYRSSNGLIRPYIECYFPKDFLSEIWLPNNNKYEDNKRSIERLLRQYDYAGVEIKKSDNPFRNI